MPQNLNTLLRFVISEIVTKEDNAAASSFFMYKCGFSNAMYFIDIPQESVHSNVCTFRDAYDVVVMRNDCPQKCIPTRISN